MANHKQDDREFERMLYNFLKLEHENGNRLALHPVHEMGEVLVKPTDDELLDLMSDGTMEPEPYPALRRMSKPFIARPAPRWVGLGGR